LATGNAASSSASDVGITSAAPTAWIARNPTSSGIDVAGAQVADPRVNTAVPITNTSRRP
jgi:hypothetical protein